MPVSFTPDHLWDQHGDRLSQHGGLGLDSADAPPQHAQAVDHGGVRIGANQRVRISDRAARSASLHENHARQIFQVHLVNDASIGRDDGEVPESSLSPAQEGIALLVAEKFELGIELKCLRRAEFVHLHRVVDDQLSGLKRD